MLKIGGGAQECIDEEIQRKAALGKQGVPLLREGEGTIKSRERQHSEANIRLVLKFLEA